MSKYIELDKVLGKLCLDHNDVIYIDKRETAKRIEKIQSIDIVRCKECWHGTDIKNGKKFCIRCDIMDDLLMIADGFCNFGEREGE